MTIRFALALVLSLCLSRSVGQSFQPAAFTDPDRRKKLTAIFPVIDQLYKDYASQNHLPGLVYGIVVDGQLVHTGNLGYTDISNKTEANTQSAFRIASMTKSFTAMAILKLRDEGKLKLDDPASMYIPEMKDLKYVTRDAAAITIRHLLTHAAGFPEDNPWGDRQLAASDDELIALYKNGISFSNNPGLGYEYSNLGFATLGYIIKKVSGLAYQDYISQNILVPLGMTHTYWEYTKVPKAQLAHGYRWVNTAWVEQPLLHDGAYGAMGGMITTIEDFSKYMALHLAAWPARDDKESGPVKRSSIREMHFPWNLSGLNSLAKASGGRLCPTVTAYNYGIRYARDCDSHIFVGHTGGLPGFGSEWTIMPEYGIGAVSFANLTYARAGIVNKLALDTLLALSKIKPRILPPSAILVQRKADLINILPEWKKAEATGIFADNFFLDNFNKELKDEAERIFAQAGQIKGSGEVIAENQMRGYFLLYGANADIRISFTLTPQQPGLIQEYHISLVN
jgi:CubicO group peptidase (beta-lactamase class C family)